jgi:hypothetical protein
MDVIKSITNKKEWEKKIDDPKITNKWIAELKKQGLNNKVGETIIQMLKEYNSYGKDKYYEDDSFNWVAEVQTDVDEIGLICDCECYICSSGEAFMDAETYDELREQSPEYYPLTSDEILMQQCNCEDKLESKTSAYLDSCIRQGEFVSADMRERLIKNVNLYQKDNFIDYHPGSNDKVIDIVHPSLYPYVKNITKLKKESKIPFNDATFQWLPCDVTTKRDDDGEVSLVRFTSSINNIDHKKYPELYRSIGEIFSRFVKPFDDVVKKMVERKKIKSYPGLDKCQVIIKIGRIYLKNNSSYEGGVWHLEGMPAEKIIATGIYYYDMENIEDHKLKFRTTIGESYKLDYPQDGEEFVRRHYGMEDVEYRGKSSVIDLGGVAIKKNNCLVFPNYLQHCVDPFDLKDKDKFGYRDILVFFLVDPSERITSTADLKKPNQNVMTLYEAKKYREILMYQRKYEIENQSKFYERAWSLCEH